MKEQKQQMFDDLIRGQNCVAIVTLDILFYIDYNEISIPWTFIVNNVE